MKPLIRHHGYVLEPDTSTSPATLTPSRRSRPTCAFGARYELATIRRRERPPHLALPERCVEALLEQRQRQGAQRLAGFRGNDSGLVFASEAGTPLDAANVRRGFRRIATAAGLNAAQWTPRELRHSFVSLLSDKGVPIEQIARLVGHSGGSAVTETVYRKQLRPVINDGAVAMNELFPQSGSYSVSYSPRVARSKRPGPELR